ncbi:MAG TPA: hypothetical protein VFE07_14930 [Marmoricola sp.]|nr:hypothetical protein [Marmoricola sp.]
MSLPRRRALLVVLACLGLAVGGMVVGPANAASPAPVQIRIDAISSATPAPGGSAEPSVLVKAGDPIYIDVSFWDGVGPDAQPASFNSDTTLSISSSAGTLTPATGTAPRGLTSTRLTTSLGTAENQVALTVSVASKRKHTSDVLPGTSSEGQIFDVVSDLRFGDSTAGDDFTDGIGGDSNCANATRQAPVCGIVMLPNGAHGSSNNVALSLGKCDPDSDYAKCNGAVVQALANLGVPGEPDGLYSPTSPATLVVKCDKSLCKGGSISQYHLIFTLTGNGALNTTAPDCPAKGTLGGDQDACVDYVQSTRDGAGDTLLYLLFARDLRVGMG